MDKRIGVLFENLKKRNISAVYCENKKEAEKMLLEIVPASATIGISGSQTLEQIGIVSLLEARGNKVFNQYRQGLSKQESLEMRMAGAGAEFYLASANAISQEGELVFFSAFSNRICGISTAENLILVCGVNKIALNLEAAIKRAREYVTPLNCKRLNWGSACVQDMVCHNEKCFTPEYKRMCCQILIIEAEINPGRMKVVMVGESLGY